MNINKSKSNATAVAARQVDVRNSLYGIKRMLMISTAFLAFSASQAIASGTIAALEDVSELPPTSGPWTPVSNLIVGDTSHGEIHVSGGAEVTTNSLLQIGENPGADGIVTISDASSLWTANGAVIVGVSGIGKLHILVGSTFEATNQFIIGQLAGSKGSVEVSGLLDLTGAENLIIGQDGSGTLRVTLGGHIKQEDADIVVKAIGGESSKLEASGLNSNIEIVDGNLSIHADTAAGTAEFHVLDNATVNIDGNLQVQNHATVLIDGAGSRVSADRLTSTSAEVVISNGAVLDTSTASQSSVISASNTHDAIVKITGTNAQWDDNGLIIDSVAPLNKGRLIIEQGGEYSSSGQTTVGYGGDGDVLVTGTNSKWLNTGGVTFGYGTSKGTATITDGALFESGLAMLQSAEITVSGAGSKWKNTGTLKAGDGYQSDITLTDGGILESGVIRLGMETASASTATGNINIGAASGNLYAAPGILNATRVDLYSAGHVIFNHTATSYNFETELNSPVSGISHGITHLYGITTLATPSIDFKGRINVTGGTLIVGANYGYPLPLWGNPTLVVSSQGSTIIDTSAAFEGHATVDGGNLAVSGILRAHDALTLHNVQNGGKLSGSGTIVGSVNVLSGGHLIGSNGQTLTINGDLNVSSDSSIDVALGAPNANPLFNVLGNVVLPGSTLNISNQGGLTDGIYKIFYYTGTQTGADTVIIGTKPAGSRPTDFSISTIAPNEINLISYYSGAELRFWDGGDVTKHDNDAVDGGSGVWRSDGANWTDQDGSLNGPYNPNPSFAVFMGTPGTVTVDNSAGIVSTEGMQFTVDGYVLNGSALKLDGTGGESIIRIGSGSASDANIKTTIEAALTGGSTLVKKDGGTLILSGANNYDGGTRIEAGTVQISQDMNLGALVGDVIFAGGTLAVTGDMLSARAVMLQQNAAINVAEDMNLILTGTVSGAGILNKTGEGSLKLSGINDYSGGTHLTAGILTIESDDNLGAAASSITFLGGGLSSAADITTSRDIFLATNGWFDVADNIEFELAGTLTGSGGFEKTGEGTLILSGVNNYTGATTIMDGTLIGNSSSIKGDIRNAGTLIFNEDAQTTFAGNITGVEALRGTILKKGSGELTLDGTSSLDWTIEQGGLKTAASRFLGNAALHSGTNLSFEQSNTSTYAGVISGAGNFNIAGGTITLTGNSSAFTGNTTVKSGTNIIVGVSQIGALGGNITLESGATLAGTGTVGSTGSTVTLSAGATHDLGDQIATQTFAGNYANHGTLRIKATPDTADKIVVAGSVDITGAHLELVLSPDNRALWKAINGAYTIIEKQSDGAITGTFASPIVKNLLFLDEKIAYNGGNGNDVTLTLERNSRDFASVGATQNQIAVGKAADTLTDKHGVWRALVLATDENEVRSNLDSLSGEVHTSVQTSLIQDTGFVYQTANNRIRAAFGDAGARASSIPIMSYAPGGKPIVVDATNEGPAIWADGFGSWGRVGSQNGTAGVKRSTGGFLAGADAQAGEWRVGAMGGYSQSNITMNERTSSSKSNNYHIGAFAGSQWGNIAVRAVTGYTWHDISTSRQVVVPGLNETLTANYKGGTFQAFGEVSYKIEVASVKFEPFANLAHVSLRTNGFTETGGVAALSGAARTTSTTFTTLGLRAAHDVSFGGVDATLSGLVGWRHAYGHVAPQNTLAFSAGDAFSVVGAPIARNSAVIEAGVDFKLTPASKLGVTYTGQLSNKTQDHGFKAGFNMSF